MIEAFVDFFFIPILVILVVLGVCWLLATLDDGSLGR